MTNIQHRVSVPSTKARNSPKSTSASAPGALVWGTATRNASLVSSLRTAATNGRTVDSATSTPCSATRRCQTRLAVWR